MSSCPSFTNAVRASTTSLRTTSSSYPRGHRPLVCLRFVRRRRRTPEATAPLYGVRPPRRSRRRAPVADSEPPHQAPATPQSPPGQPRVRRQPTATGSAYPMPQWPRPRLLSPARHGSFAQLAPPHRATNDSESPCPRTQTSRVEATDTPVRTASATGAGRGLQMPPLHTAFVERQQPDKAECGGALGSNR